MIRFSRRQFIRIFTFTAAFSGVIIRKSNTFAIDLKSAKLKERIPILNINEAVNEQVEFLVQRLKEKGIIKTPREIEKLKEQLRNQLKAYFMTRFELSNH